MIFYILVDHLFLQIGESLSMQAAKPRSTQAEWTARWMFAPRWALTPPSSYRRGEPPTSPPLAASRILKRGPPTKTPFWFRAYSIPAISCSQAVFFFFLFLLAFGILAPLLLQHLLLLLLRRNWKWMIKSLATPPTPPPLSAGRVPFSPTIYFPPGRLVVAVV